VRRALLVALCVAGTARADKPDPRAARVDYIARVIDALRESDPVALADTTRYLATVERNKCQAPEPSLRVGCVLEAAAQNCKRADAEAQGRCLAVSDVIATNRLSETIFVPREVRFRLLEESRDIRTAVARELHAQYALLVTELAMTPDFPGAAASTPALAAAIEAHCRASAGTRELSWQHCVAAIAWFIATDGRPPEEKQR
jgi:hypothetical protein